MKTFYVGYTYKRFRVTEADYSWFTVKAYNKEDALFKIASRMRDPIASYTAQENKPDCIK